MKIAVACTKEYKVAGFGHGDGFAVYEFKGDYFAPVGKEFLETNGESDPKKLTDLLNQKDVAMLLCDGLGMSGRNALLDVGILPAFGYRGDAEEGATGLMHGDVPIPQLSCDSCGGDCSSGHCGE